MRRPVGAPVLLRQLPPLRVGSLRVIPLQLPLMPGWAGDGEKTASGGPSAPNPAWHAIGSVRRGQSDTTFIGVPSRSVLNPPGSTHMNFWSLNPYVGCEFGCTYCYARDTHRYAVERAEENGAGEGTAAEFNGLEGWEAFEKRILVKTGAADTLARTLKPGRIGRRPIVIGTATDPYQPAERKFGITRRILDTLAHYRGLSITIITKSPLVVRDIEVLRRLRTRHDVSVAVSIASLDSVVLRKLEPRSPVPAARLRALTRLTAADIDAGVLIAPILPGLTDGRQQLSRLIRSARRAGAGWVMSGALRLGPAARKRFLPYLEVAFPELARQYRRHYAGRSNASAEYQAALARRIQELKAAQGFDEQTRWRETDEEQQADLGI